MSNPACTWYVNVTVPPPLTPNKGPPDPKAVGVPAVVVIAAPPGVADKVNVVDPLVTIM
jgi:hypothetical protein